MALARSLVLALAFGPAGALAACLIAEPTTSWKECSNGRLCPADTACSPDGARCISCGDGNQDEEEECDDGNLIDGDGCDRNCTRTGCGNGIRTAGEACDDGNPRNGDACSSDCLKICSAWGCRDHDPEATEREAEEVSPPGGGDPAGGS